MPTPYIAALLLHGLLAGVDVLLNHEWLARLPRRAGAAGEEALHSLRECVFAAIFAGLAWFEWHGAWAWAIGALLLAELAIALVDVVLEPAIRVLPVPERALHLLLFVNLGVVMTLTGGALLAWLDAPTALVPADHGWASVALSALAALALGWGVRDGLAARRLAGAAPSAP